MGDLTGFAGGMVSYVGDRESIFASNPCPGPLFSCVRQTFPGYTKTDLRAGVKYDSWTTSLYVNNVTDARGALNGGAGYQIPFAFVYIRPRTVGLTVTKAFGSVAP